MLTDRLIRYGIVIVLILVAILGISLFVYAINLKPQDLRHLSYQLMLAGAGLMIVNIDMRFVKSIRKGWRTPRSKPSDR